MVLFVLSEVFCCDWCSWHVTNTSPTKKKTPKLKSLYCDFSLYYIPSLTLSYGEDCLSCFLLVFCGIAGGTSPIPSTTKLANWLLLVIVTVLLMLLLLLTLCVKFWRFFTVKPSECKFCVTLSDFTISETTLLDCLWEQLTELCCELLFE